MDRNDLMRAVLASMATGMDDEDRAEMMKFDSVASVESHIKRMLALKPGDVVYFKGKNSDPRKAFFCEFGENWDVVYLLYAKTEFEIGGVRSPLPSIRFFDELLPGDFASGELPQHP